MGHGCVLDDGGAVPQVGQSRGSNAFLLRETMFHNLKPSVSRR